MSQITDVPPEDLKIGLREKGEIFAVPSYTGDEDYEYQTASEYLSGDIYAKLDMAKHTLRSTAYMNQMLSP